MSWGVLKGELPLGHGQEERLLFPLHHVEAIELEFGWPEPIVEAIRNESVDRSGVPPKREREINCWLRETWIHHGKPKGATFFTLLKKHVETDGSPVKNHIPSGRAARIEFEVSFGATGSLKRETIQTLVSEFWKEERERRSESTR